ncbi:PTS sugar transporter subunit IIA [Clostridium ljungdahlii]|uniref:Mannitol-specific phosphotransferase enzyme IIA component n=1 Tax=Clostridium ljungdahlii TaxID=1538 RepID=A0A166SJM0_9CLOT|nr:PTS sugar transporter subunit IIA [Clostridium ljungdahlii]OAA92400.1 Mannitol-specific phosphotransferase enzyme IIA component [Clostridium ljungdahlii]
MKPEVLCEQNILLNIESETKNEAIKRVGRLLVENGYVDEKYIKGMIKRNDDISTYIGNGVAIPHGMNEYVKYIKYSGIVIAQYPHGVDFGEGNIAYLVIGIAGKGDDHMSILSKIAIACQDKKNVQKLVEENDKNVMINLILEGE